MPKVKRISESEDFGNGSQKVVFDIYYTTKLGFFGKLPAEYLPDLELMTDDAKDKAHVRWDSIDGKVLGATEDEAYRNTVNLIKQFCTQKVVRRPVILVFFDNKKDDHFSSKIFQKEFPPLSLDFSFKYTTEVTIPGQLPKYYDFWMYEGLSSPRQIEQKKNIYISWTQKYVVLDDTPENRNFLETAHAKLHILAEKLSEVLTDAEKISTLVSGGHLLLS